MTDDDDIDGFEWTNDDDDDDGDSYDDDDTQPKGLRRGRPSTGSLKRPEVMPETDFKTLIGLGAPTVDVGEEEYKKRERKERIERERKRANMQQKDAGAGGENDWSLKDVVVVTVDKDTESAKGAFSWLSDRLDESAARAMCGDSVRGEDEGSSAVEFMKLLQFFTFEYTGDVSRKMFEENLNMLGRQLELSLVPFVYVVSETLTVLLKPGGIHITPHSSARRLLRELLSESKPCGNGSQTNSKAPYVSLQGKENVKRLLILLLRPEFFKRVTLLSPKPFIHSTVCIADVRFGTSLKFDSGQSKKACNCDTMTITSHLLPGALLHSQLLPLIRKQIPDVPSDSVVVRSKPSPNTAGFASIKPQQESLK